MTKIEELLYSKYRNLVADEEDAIAFAKEYSELFARKSLEKAAEEVVVNCDIINDRDFKFAIESGQNLYNVLDGNLEVYALKHSITDIELPKHE